MSAVLGNKLTANRDLNVTEDDLLQAKEHAKGLSLEETREVWKSSSHIS